MELFVTRTLLLKVGWTVQYPGLSFGGAESELCTLMYSYTTTDWCVEAPADLHVPDGKAVYP
jgi:predicted component of type VI protein secretion system